MNKLLVLFLLCPIVAFANSISLSSSQARLPNETFQDALTRSKAALTKNQIRSLVAKDTPVGKKVPFNKLDYSIAVEVKTHEELIHLFNVIRDSRFLHTNSNPEFDRRISWLYPDDGCFARATVAGMKLSEEELLRPSKIFAFGELAVSTPYSPYGSVHWWYHVAPLVQYNGAYYVLDPALDATGPLLVLEWFSRMGLSSDLNGAVCNSYTYDPFDSCYKATADSDSRALSDQSIYLEKEWNRVSTLGFDPYFILGKNPPWVFDIPQLND